MRSRAFARAIVAIFALATAHCLPSSASEPVDPLRRRELGAGSIEIAVGAAYLPRYEEAIVAGPGGPELERRVHHAVGLEFAIKYRTSRRLSFSVARSWSGQVMVSERAVLPEGNWAGLSVSRAPGDHAAAFGLVWSPWPDHPLEPAIRIQVAGEGTAALGLSASAIRDPVVFSGRIGVSRNRGEADTLELSLGAGFVANDRVSFGASVSHATAPGTARRPVTVLTARVGYAPGARSTAEIGVTASLYVGGESPSAGFGVFWQGEVFPR